MHMLYVYVYIYIYIYMYIYIYIHVCTCCASFMESWILKMHSKATSRHAVSAQQNVTSLGSERVPHCELLHANIELLKVITPAEV